MPLMRQLRRSGSLLAFIFLALLFGGCGGRTVNKRAALDLLTRLPSDVFDKDDVTIESLSQTGARDLIVETRLRAAFRFERVEGKWSLREVRLGNGAWERFDDLMRALQAVKTEETRRLLEQVGASVTKYRDKNGRLPDFRDYVSLSDALHPEFLSPLIRFDAWRNPLAAHRLGPNAIRLVSPGPDGKLSSADDISLTKDYTN